MSNSTTNGIATAFWSRDGIISGCVVEGVSKPGIYLAGARRVTVVGCMAKNIKCTAAALEDAGAGFQTGQSREVSFIDCHATGCATGFNIICMGTYGDGTVDASPAPSLTSFSVTLSSAHLPYRMDRLGIWNPTTKRIVELPVTSATNTSGNTWAITLAASNTESITAGAKIFVNYEPYRNVRIIGGSSKNNVLVHNSVTSGHGVVVSSLQAGAVGRDLIISGLICEGNPSAGIKMAAVEDALVDGCILRDNGAGIQLTDIALPATPEMPAQDVTNRIMISGCEIYDNTNFGVQLRSVEDVTIQGTRIYRTKDTVQAFPILISKVGESSRKTANVKLRDIDFSGYDLSKGPSFVVSTPVVPSIGDSDAVESGLYDLAFFGAPEGVLYAPPGSRYVDRATGASYRKAHGWKKSNWIASLTHQRRTEDATTTLVNLYVVPDNSVVHASIVAVARCNNGESAVYRRALGAKRHNPNEAAAVGTAQTIGSDGEDDADWSFNVVVAYNTIRAVIVGEAGKTIDWLIRTEVDVYTP
jgi:hypothetical protein